jgi:hypothetical protein
MEYAKDAMTTYKPWKLWQFKTHGREEWLDACKELHWDHAVQYRRKPKTININGFEVPEPMREAPKQGTEYCIPYLLGQPETHCWYGSSIDKSLLKAGLVHATYEAADLHSKALRSFTEVWG